MIRAIKEGNINSLELLIQERKNILTEINSLKNLPSTKEHNEVLKTYELLMDELAKNLNRTKIELNTTIKSKNIIRKYKLGNNENGNLNNI